MRTKFAIFMLIVLLICVVSCDSEKITSGSSETPVENPTETPTQPSEPTAKAIGTLAELEDAMKTERQ